MKSRRVSKESQMPSYKLLLEATTKLLEGKINVAIYSEIREGVELLSEMEEVEPGQAMTAD